jgi:hypothetical protein
MRATLDYAAKRGWTIAIQIEGWFRRRRTRTPVKDFSPRTPP